MEIKELTQKMHDFVGTKGWYAADSPKPQTPRNLAISLAIESMEVLEHFQWDDSIQDQKEFEQELADVALYLLQLASITGVDLERVILDKLEKNYTRTWTKTNLDQTQE
jgi:8-oxo-dGTP diphosphatase